MGIIFHTGKVLWWSSTVNSSFVVWANSNSEHGTLSWRWQNKETIRYAVVIPRTVLWLAWQEAAISAMMQLGLAGVDFPRFSLILPQLPRPELLSCIQQLQRQHQLHLRLHCMYEEMQHSTIAIWPQFCWTVPQKVMGLVHPPPSNRPKPGSSQQKFSSNFLRPEARDAGGCTSDGIRWW